MLAAASVYAVATVACTWPLALHPASRLGAPVGPGDPYLYLWVFGWVMETLLRAPGDLVNGRVFNANIFYPAESTLAYSDHMLVQSVALTPLYAATRGDTGLGDVVLCYNVLLFASFLLSGLAMHGFVRAVTGSTGGAYLAGLAWAFWPYRFAHLVHIQLQALYFLPLAFLFVHRVIAGRRRRDALGLGVVMGLQALSSVYYAVVGAVGIGIGAIALAVAVGRWRSGAIARRLVLAAVVGGVLVAPVAWVYWRVQRDQGFGRTLFEASRNAATMQSYAQVPAENVAYGRTGLLHPGMLERALYPGMVVLGLALVGAVRGYRSDARPLVTAMAAVGALGFVLSLGPDGVRDFYVLFQRYVFGFQAIRAPARFSVLVMFALATLAALGWRELARTGITARRCAWALTVVAAVEYLNVPMPLAAAPPRESAVGQWLRREPGDGAVVHLPVGVDLASTPAMVQSLEHRRPLVNGYSGQRPEFYNALVDSLNAFPGDEALLALKEAGVRFVVTESAMHPAAGQPWPLVERARFADGVIYELHWTPEIESRLAADPAVAPPPVGRIPFEAGETARYSAFWAGAGMNVAAGEITIAVERSERPRGAPGFALVARGETAPWMSRFFEAHDTFTTHTGPDLLPRTHRRDELRGSREASRLFLYSHGERVVRIGRDERHATGEDGLALPLAAEARDALSAVFYTRTLELGDGDRYRIPVNDGGRNLLVEIVVTGRETVSVQGRPVRAIRLDPRIERRVERRRPVTATLWLSDDQRRLPVALDLDAAFGHVRLELVSYAP